MYLHAYTGNEKVRWFSNDLFLSHAGSERPNTGFVTKEIKTGIKSSYIDNTDQSYCRFDSTVCDFITHSK